VVGNDPPAPDSNNTARKAEKKARKKANKQAEERRRAMGARQRRR
jgi:hypothetical protein